MNPEMYGGETPPPHFMNYVSVENVDEVTTQEATLGATVVAPPMDIPNVGRFSAIQDPTGAIFSLISLNESYPPIPLTNDPGDITWYELNTKDIEKAKAFYNRLFGWEITGSNHNKDYFQITIEGIAFGGMLQINQDWGADWEKIPSSWLNYIAVENCDGSVKKIKENGGNICMDEFVVENVGKMAVGSDPTGAVFSVIQMLG